MSESCNEARAYVQHRLGIAGGEPALFQPEAVAYIHARARGVPRLMNQLCHLALVYAFAEQRRSIDERLVRQVLQERNHGRAMRVFSAELAALPLPSNRRRDHRHRFGTQARLNFAAATSPVDCGDCAGGFRG